MNVLSRLHGSSHELWVSPLFGLAEGLERGLVLFDEKRKNPGLGLI